MNFMQAQFCFVSIWMLVEAFPSQKTSAEYNRMNHKFKGIRDY